MVKENKQRESKGRIYYGYVVVAVAFIILTIMWGAVYSFGVFFKPLQNEFGWTSAQTSLAFSLFMVIHGLFYIVTGRINDRLGPRIVVIICGFLLGTGYLLMSQISAIWQLYVIYGLLIGIGMSGGLVPLASTVSRWFIKRRSLMTGICVSGIGMGTMIMPPIANWLISSYNWRTSFAIIGMVTLVLIVLAAQFLRRSPQEKEQENVNIEGGFSFRQAVKTKQLWMLFIAFFGFGFYLQTIIVHIVPYALKMDISPANAAFVMTVIGALSLAARVVVGFIADRIGNKRATVIGFVVMAIAACVLIVSKQLWGIYLVAAMLGFGYGGLMAVQSPLLADLFGLRSHGVIFGVILFVTTIGGGLGPVVAGHISDLTGSYHIVFLIFIIISALSIALSSLLRPTSAEHA